MVCDCRDVANVTDGGVLIDIIDPETAVVSLSPEEIGNWVSELGGPTLHCRR